MNRRALLASTVTAMAFFLALPGGLSADLLDYDPQSGDWTGLSRMVDAARTVGIEVEVSDELDFRQLDAERPLIIVYPQNRLDVSNLTRYVVDGGRVLLADDFGESEEFLDRLEIQRVVPDATNLPHDRFANDNRALPIVRSRGRHALLEGVREIVANHPAVISNVGGPVLQYDGGGGLVYDMNLGDGKVIVAGDASLFINQMLAEADNEVFLVNALRYICDGRTNCSPILLTKDFEQVGTYSDSPFDLGDVGSFDAINEALRELVDSMPGAEFLYWLSILMAFGLAVYVGSVFPFRRTRPYSAYVSDFLGAIPVPQSEFDWNVSRFGRGSRTMNYALPMAILKEIFEELFLSELGQWPSGADERPDIARLGDEFAARYLAERTPDDRRGERDKLLELLAKFAQIPPRSRVFLDNDAHFTEGDLLEFYRRAQHVLKIMGLEDEYQRRTRGIV